MDGEGLFNWRYVFPFDYMPAVRMLLARRSDKLFSLSFRRRGLERRSPVLYVQLWDNSRLHSDKHIGQLELPLLRMAPPAHDEWSCTLDGLQVDGDERSSRSSCSRCCCCFGFGGSGSGHVEDQGPINLFEKRHVKGFWPCYLERCVGERQTRELRGKVELELELLTEEEARERPAGVGRSEPNDHPHLDKPKRPADSFLWLVAPWKTFRYIVWRHKKCIILRYVFCFLLVLLVLALIFNLPVHYTRTLLLCIGR